jgi:hypothetical protein
MSTGRTNEKSAQPVSLVRFGHKATCPHARAGMERQLANGDSTMWASSTIEFNSDGPPPSGADPVSDPTLVGSCAQRCEPRWDPILDEAYIPASTTSSGFMCRSPTSLMLVITRETVVDWAWDPISAELEVTAGPIDPPCRGNTTMQPSQAVSRACTSPACTSQPSPVGLQVPSLQSPLLEAILFEVGVPSPTSLTCQPLQVSPAPQQQAQQMPPGVHGAPVPSGLDNHFVNRSRGASPGSMVAGSIPCSPSSFIQ